MTSISVGLPKALSPGRNDGKIWRPFRNRFQVAMDFLTAKSHCRGLPVEMSIELTSRCNLKCVMCSRDDESPRGLGNMRFETFRRIIDQSAGHLEFAYLHLAGEPLLHPQFDTFIDYAASKGVKIGLSTNGTILTSSKARRLIQSKLDTLIISIDGTNRDTYRKIRGADSFNKVIRNTDNFLKMKSALGGGPRAVVQMICMKENYHQAKEFCNRWQGMGVDAVRLKRFFNFAGNVKDFSPESPDKENIDRRNIPVETRAKSSRPPCYLPWRQLAFYYDGTAVACCHDFLHQGVIGNIHDASLRKIWNSHAMVALRRNHLQRRQDKIPLCKGCNQPEVSAAQVLGTAVCNASRAKNLLITMERLGRRLGFKPFY